jgi:glycosyltransferase involved in cell wall biosynthesis
VPILYNKPFVVTIHDLTMYHYPRPEATTLGPLKFWFKDKAHRLVVRHAVRKAKKIIVTSEFTKQDVRKTLGVPMEKMVVTYQAPFERYKLQDTNKFKIQNSKFKITEPYVLYVGAAYPHKNLGGLLKAWKIFCEKYGEDYKLVLVGQKNYFYNNLQSSIFNLKSVVHLDNVSDDELVSLYSNASLFVFPSLYEGFGLPPLEAMSHGVPVASSNRACMPEVLGEAALYFDPENYEQMADVIHRGLMDEDVRFQLKNNASELLKAYSWEKLARETLCLYEDVMNMFPSPGRRGVG